MKNENIFIGDICQVIKINHIPGKISGILKNPYLEYLLTARSEIEYTIIKSGALLRKINDYTYPNLETKQKYRYEAEDELGMMFINEKTLIPYNSLFKQEETDKYITRRRILKKYNDLKQKVYEEYSK